MDPSARNTLFFQANFQISSLFLLDFQGVLNRGRYRFTNSRFANSGFTDSCFTNPHCANFPFCQPDENSLIFFPFHQLSCFLSSDTFSFSESVSQSKVHFVRQASAVICTGPDLWSVLEWSFDCTFHASFNHDDESKSVTGLWRAQVQDDLGTNSGYTGELGTYKFIITGETGQTIHCFHNSQVVGRSRSWQNGMPPFPSPSPPQRKKDWFCYTTLNLCVGYVCFIVGVPVCMRRQCMQLLSPCLHTLSYIHVQCYLPFWQLYQDFRNFSNGVCHVRKMLSIAFCFFLKHPSARCSSF